VSPIYHLLASKTARVVEWQTRTFEGRMPKGMRVQVPPRAPQFYALTREIRPLIHEGKRRFAFDLIDFEMQKNR
jgi:hypothetical protein